MNELIKVPKDWFYGHIIYASLQRFINKGFVTGRNLYNFS